MWYLFYNTLLLLGSPLILLVLLVKRRSRRGLLERLGKIPKHLKADREQTIWIHAVSLGEVMTVVPLVQALYARFSGVMIVVSTITETGREAVEQKLAREAVHCYLPMDFSWVISRYIRLLRPRAFVFVETELWPNLLRCLSTHKVPTVLVNGRISSRSFRRYRIVRPFISQVLEKITLILTQSDRDLTRFVHLGADSSRVHHTGNMKFDQGLGEHHATLPTVRPETLGLKQGEKLIVAGSTHLGEEEEILKCYKRLCLEFSSLVLLIAPRHVERVDQIERLVASQGHKVFRRSALGLQASGLDSVGGPRVVILDSRGELSQLYAYGCAAFVGGTWVPIGGHNLLEPASYGVPVFFGPYTDHCLEVAELLLKAGGGASVRTGDELADMIAKGLRNREWFEQMGNGARAAVMANQGVVKRNVEYISEVWSSCLAVEAKRVFLEEKHKEVRKSGILVGRE